MTTALDCPACGRARANGDPMCGLCGTLLQRRMPRASPPARIERRPSRANGRPDGAGGAAALWSVGVGAVLAPLFSLTPVLCYMGWFLGSLTHEMGHSAVAWLFGCPAYPAIRLDGHAAAFHRPQVMLLALTAWAALAWGAWIRRDRLSLALPLGLATLLYPVFAFTDLREVLHLLGGHLGELTFATVFFWRALSGGFSPSRAERIAYGTVAWFLLGRNIALTFGLITNPTARAEYAESGSFGFTNDYIRVAEDVLGWSLPSVAALMLACALAVPPLAVALWRISAAADAADRR